MLRNKTSEIPSGNKATRAILSIRHVFSAGFLCLAAGALLWAQKPLQFNTYYECNNQRIVVRSCVDQSDKDYNDCIVQLPDRPPINGQTPATTILRRNLIQTIQQCRVLGPAPSAFPAPGQATAPRGAAPGFNNAGNNSQGLTFNSILSTAINAVSTLFLVLISLVVLALVGWWAYNKIYYSRHFVVRRRNKEALEAFGMDQATREKNIVEAFDSGAYTLTIKGENRAKGQMMWFVLKKPIGTFKRQDLECLRFAYFTFNRGLLDEERFYTYRITAMYQSGMTDPSDFGYIGWSAFWRKRNKVNEIGRARMAVNSLFAPNCTQNLYNQTFALLQNLMAQHPGDEFFIDMWQRMTGGARWLGIGDIKRSAFALPDRPTPYYVQFGPLEGTNTMLTYSGDGSILTVAPPGQGKTTCDVIPNLLRWPGAAIVLDVKGEIYDLTSKYRSTIGPVIKFSPLDPEHSKCYNPLAFIRREPLYVWEDASNAATMMIVPGEGGEKNKFFEDSARDVLTAIIADLAYWHKPEDRAMTKVLSILNRNGWDEFLERLRKNPEVSAMQDLGVSLAQEHPETLSNILSFARSSMNSWKGERISMITKKSDWHPLDLRSGKHPTIYICINSEDIETYASLLRVFIAQHINLLLAQKVPPQGAEPILFCLDEFPRLGGMKPIETALAVGRGYKIRLWLFAQDFLQIEKAYTNAHAILNLCLVRTFMNPTVESAAKIVDEIGKEGVASGADFQSSTSAQELSGPNFKDLQIVVGASSKPAKTVKMPYYKNDELKTRVGSLDDVAGSVTEKTATA